MSEETRGTEAAHSPSSEDGWRLGVVVAGGLEAWRLTEVETWLFHVGRLGLPYRLVVVERSRPGEWWHQVSDRIFQVGGSQGGGRLAAYDRGRRFLQAQSAAGLRGFRGEEVESLSLSSPSDASPQVTPGPEDGTAEPWVGAADAADLWLFADEMWRRRDPSALEQLDPRALSFAAHRGALLGWIDSLGTWFEAFGYGYHSWLDPGCLLMPEAVRRRLGDLETGLGSRPVADAGHGGLASEAPLTEPLRRYLAGRVQRIDGLGAPEAFEGWVTAILRGHLLSARLQSLGAEAFDTRWLQSPPGDLEGVDLSWKEGGSTARNRLRWSLDRVELPERVVHGDAARLRVSGWVRGGAGAHDIEVICGDLAWTTRADVLRRDLLPAGDVESVEPSQVAGARCGFELYRSLQGLEPGVHQVRWCVAGTDVRKNLGWIEVRSRREVRADLA